MLQFAAKDSPCEVDARVLGAEWSRSVAPEAVAAAAAAAAATHVIESGDDEPARRRPPKKRVPYSDATTLIEYWIGVAFPNGDVWLTVSQYSPIRNTSPANTRRACTSSASRTDRNGAGAVPSDNVRKNHHMPRNHPFTLSRLALVVALGASHCSHRGRPVMGCRSWWSSPARGRCRTTRSG